MAKRLPPLDPGEVLREEFIKPLGMSPGALAKATGQRRALALSASRLRQPASAQIPLSGSARRSIPALNSG